MLRECRWSNQVHRERLALTENRILDESNLQGCHCKAHLKLHLFDRAPIANLDRTVQQALCRLVVSRPFHKD